jgi:glycosyltransferase involved in cell wall biosynthesis
LFRDFKRYALAGFPTKAMESLAYGCPIITNAVGDLSKFAENNVNALVMSESEIARQLPTMLVETMSDSRYVLMADAARRTAIELFSPIAYQEEFSEFIESVLGRKLRD